MSKYTKPLTLAATVCALAVGGWAYAQSDNSGAAGGSPAGDPARSLQNPSQPSGSLSTTPNNSGTMSSPSTSTDSTSSPSPSGSMGTSSDPANRMNADTGTSSSTMDTPRAARDDRN